MDDATATRYTSEGFLLSNFEESRRPVALPGPDRARRIKRIAIWLAIATICSTFWAGVGAWVPMQPVFQSINESSLMPIRQALLANWWGGLQFSLALMAILAAHELGHYVLTLRYQVPSTPPLFIPFPLYSPIGTMGAVIMMQSGTADRKQIFDIGLAGPIAGLLVAIPIIMIGLWFHQPIAYVPSAELVMGQPLLIQWLAMLVVPDVAANYAVLDNSQTSPLLMAGWVGLLVTGLNMMPLGQLDGGHVAFGLVGPRSYYIGVAALLSSIAYMITTGVVLFWLMLVLVLLMGLRHPPSSDDTRELGLPRQMLGWCSLVLPLLCIPANPIIF